MDIKEGINHNCLTILAKRCKFHQWKAHSILFSLNLKCRIFFSSKSYKNWMLTKKFICKIFFLGHIIFQISSPLMIQIINIESNTVRGSGQLNDKFERLKHPYFCVCVCAWVACICCLQDWTDWCWARTTAIFEGTCLALCPNYAH